MKPTPQQPTLEEMLQVFPSDSSNDWQLFAFTSGNFQLQLSCPVGTKYYQGKDLRAVIEQAYNEIMRARADKMDKTNKTE